MCVPASFYLLAAGRSARPPLAAARKPHRASLPRPRWASATTRPVRGLRLRPGRLRLLHRHPLASLQVGGRGLARPRPLRGDFLHRVGRRVRGLAGSSPGARWLQMAMAAGLVFGLGWGVGSFIVGLYLLCPPGSGDATASRRSRRSASRTTRTSCACTSSEEGTLTIYPIGLDRVPRRWRESAPGEPGRGGPSTVLPDDPCQSPPPDRAAHRDSAAAKVIRATRGALRTHGALRTQEPLPLARLRHAWTDPSVFRDGKPRGRRSV